MMRAFILAGLALTGCMAPAPEGASSAPIAPPSRSERPPDDPALSYGGFNEDIDVDGLIVRPLVALEDSRCPVDVDCVWSGQMVIRIRVAGMPGDQQVSTIRSLALPGGGELQLASVWPPRLQTEDAIPPYRFGFRRR